MFQHLFRHLKVLMTQHKDNFSNYRTRTIMTHILKVNFFFNEFFFREFCLFLCLVFKSGFLFKSGLWWHTYSTYLAYIFVIQKKQLNACYVKYQSKWFVLKYGFQKKISFCCRCSSFLSPTFAEIKNSFTRTLLTFNSKNFGIICYRKNADENEPI